MNYQELKKELEQLEAEAKIKVLEQKVQDMQELLKVEDLRAQRLYNRVAALEERLDELEEAQDTQEIPQGVNIVVQEGAIVIGRAVE
jgi:predicted nuclease with TOPRIM domain